MKKIHEQDDTIDVEKITSLLTRGIDLPQDLSSSSSSSGTDDDDDDDKSPNVDESMMNNGNQSGQNENYHPDPKLLDRQR